MPIPLDELMGRFESLGENCEFGLVQRRCGAERLGLLRFSSAPLPKLINALTARFSGMGTADSTTIKVSPNGKEYMVADWQFGFEYHAWVLVGEQSAEEVQQRECRRIPFLVRKLIEDLTDGEKIFVYHGMAPLATEDARKLHAVLQQYGKATLLWVELADPKHSSGVVEWAFPGILKGYVDRFAPGDNAHDISLESWIAVCREAYRLFNRGYPERDPSEPDSKKHIKYAGHVDEATRFSVVGWVANHADWNQSLSVDILVNNEVAATCEANLFRKDLKDLHPDATGKYMFKFFFPTPLPLESIPDIRVRVSSSDHFLR